MRGEDQADPKPAVEQNVIETDPVANMIEQWIKIREAKGLTREAALAELTAAASLVSSIAKN
jgi:hypothetical protein